MDKTRFNQRKQRVKTQSNADTIHVQPPAAPAVAQGVDASSTSVAGHADVDTISGGKAAGVIIETQNNYYPAPAAPAAASGTTPAAGRIHGNPPTLSAAFTGREQVLADLHAVLHTANAALTPPRAAIQGLGGIGKTQTALAYLYLHQHDYADLFWAVGETPQQLASQLAAFASTLDPPVPVQADQNLMLQQVKHWFSTHDNWLLVVDNAENLSKLKNVLPPLNRGRLLLTTRGVAMSGLAKRLELDRLDEENGALLLLRRADSTKTDALLADFTPQQQADARTISRDVDGLPLALDQAGAYIETRQITPARYRELYQQRLEALHLDYDNPDHVSVAITFNMALEQVEQVPTYGPAAAQFVRLCAFLAPDAIPEEIFTAGASVLDESLASLAGQVGGFEDVYAAACRYALLRHDAEGSAFTMHRLAQEVLRDRLNDDERKAVAIRAMLAVHEAFPEPEFPTWALCARLLPHALVGIQHIRDYALNTWYAVRLLGTTGIYLKHRARYAEAEPLYVQALAIRKQVHGEEHAQVAMSLNNLGALYTVMGRYVEAASHLEQALALSCRVLGEDNADYAINLDNLAGVYYCQRRFEEATVLGEQALSIIRRTLGLQHPQVAIRLNNLANVYTDVGRYKDAERLLVEALTVTHQTIGEDDPRYAVCLGNLARLYIECKRTDEAEPLLAQSLSIVTQAHGPQHPDVAHCHCLQGQMYHKQGNVTAAAKAFRQALEIWERTLGAQHPNTVDVRKNLDFVQHKLDREGRKRRRRITFLRWEVSDQVYSIHDMFIKFLKRIVSTEHSVERH